MKNFYKTTIIFLTLFLAVNYANAADNYSEDFSNDLANWTVVDMTANQGPSNWRIADGQLFQSSNVGNGNKYTLKDHRGTVLLFNQFSGNQFDAKIDFKSNDNDGVGFVFGYQDSNNYYQFIITNEVKRATLSKVTNGQKNILIETTDTYITKKWQSLRAISENEKISIYLDDNLIAKTAFNQGGKIGISVWANKDIYFDNFSINSTDSQDVIVAGAEYEEGQSVYYTESSLFRTERSPIVHFIINNKRHQILNEEVFYDYGFNWNDVKLMVYDEIKQYPHAKVVKTPNSAAVYYINEDINKKKLILNEEIFLAYGNKWEDVVTISQGDLNSYSDIRVIKIENSTTIYELKDGIIRIVDYPEEFEQLGYQWSEVIIVKNIELNAYANASGVIVKGVEYEEGGLSDDIVNDVLADNRYLSIKTIKKNKELAIPGGSIVTMLELKLTAGLNHPVNVSAIKVVSAPSSAEIEKIIITDINNNALGSKILNYNQAQIKLSPELYIAPNSSQTIKIRMATAQNSNIAYGQLSIESTDSITTNAIMEGSFPLQGDRFRIIPGSEIIGQVDVASVEISGSLRSVSLGATDQLITKFTFSETTDNEDIYLKRLKIYNSGALSAQIANIDLVDEKNKVIATVAKPDGRYIVFDLTQAPYKISKDSEQTLSLRTDIVDGPGRKVKFIIKNKSDIWLQGGTYLFDLLSLSSESFPLGQGTGQYYNMVQINDANTVVYKNASSPVGDLTAGLNSQTLGIFDIQMDGLDLSLESITLQVINGNGVDLDDYLTIRNYKTQEVIGEVEASSATDSPAVIDVSSVKIAAGAVYTFEVVGNIDEQATTLDTYQIKITAMDFMTSNNNQAYHFNYQTYGNTIGVKRTGLTITSDSGYSDQAVATGKANNLIGSFKLQAGIAEDLIVDAFNIVEANNYDIVNYNNGYSNLIIKVNNQEYKKYSTPYGGPFISSKSFTIGAGKTVGVKVYVDTTAITDGDQVKLKINSVNVHGKNSGLTPSQTGDGSESFVTTFKQNRLTIVKNSAMADTTIVAGAGSQKVASFTFTNNGVENISINNFTISETAASDEISYNNGYSYLKTLSGTVAQPIAGGNRFGSFTIKAGAAQEVNVYVSPNTSTVGDEFNLVIKDIIVNGEIVVTGESTVGQSIRVVPAE